MNCQSARSRRSRTSTLCRYPHSRRLSLESLENRQLLTIMSFTPVKDNTLIEDTSTTLGTTSNGAGDIFVGLNSEGNRTKRGLVDFNLSSIPAGSTINSVTLSMWVNRNQSKTTMNVELHKLLADWGEAGSSGKGAGAPAQTGDATWLNTFYPSQTWAMPGGDFSSTVSGTQAVGLANASYTWSSTTQMVADVQSWVNNPASNFGWLLKGDEVNRSSHRFDSRTSATAAHRPTLTIDYTAAASNQPPTLTAISNPAAINENAGLQTVNLAGITAGAGETQALQVTAASSNTALIPNPSVSYVSPNATGSLSYTPVAYQYGSATITVTVRDNGLDGVLGNADDLTVSRTFTVTVNQVNQTPTLNAIANPAAINENAGLQTVSLSGITAGTGESQALQVTAASNNTALIPNPTVTYASPNATGSLSYAPAAYKYGTATVTVTVRDAGLDGTLGNADDATFARTFTVTVNQLNQTPTLDFIPDPTPINQNAGLQTVTLTGITAGPGDSQSLQVTAASDNTVLIPNPTVSYTSPGATGSLSHQPAAGTSGTAHVTVTVRDAGLDGVLGNADDATFARTFTVIVNQVNQPPTLNAIANPAAISENAGLQTVDLSGITAGTGESQALQVTAASSNTALIPTPTVNYASPNATGSLSYTPVAYQYGTATITVTVRDAGLDGVLGNVDDAIVSQIFTVAVNQVNQPPTLDVIANPAAINENAGVQTVNLTGIAAGVGENQALQVTATSSNTALIPAPTVNYASPNATGSLSYAPVASQYGTATITVTVRDAGLDGALGNADDGAFSRTFTVTVNQVNQTPTLDAIANPATIYENAGVQTVNLTGITAGVGEHQALQVTATSSNTALIPNPAVSYTSPDATGSLTYAPAAGQFGTASITVTVRDAGLDGILGNSDDTTATRTFAVNIADTKAGTLTPTRDNTLLKDITKALGSTSNGTGDVYVGRNSTGSVIQRGLLTFDVAGSIPAGAKIESVSLTMYVSKTATGDTPVSLHTVLSNWGEAGSFGSGGSGASAQSGDATWLNTFYNAQFWAAPGGDFSPAASGVQTIGAQGAYYTWTSTPQMVADVQNWLNTSSANFGWLLLGDETQQSSKQFASREAAVAAQRPQLTVTYVENGVPTVAAIADPAAVEENAGPQTLSLTGISAGVGETQALLITAVSDNHVLLPDPTVSYASPAAVGSLSYQPAAYHFGTAHVVVTVRDAGLDGILGNTDDATATQTFTVTVNHVNQTPTLDAIANPAAIDENAGLQTVNLTGISAGPGDSQALQVTATSDNAALIPDPVVTYASPDSTGSFAYQPATFAYGAAHITVTVRDVGLDGIFGNADDATTTQTFTVAVNQVNQTPTLGAIAEPAAIDENAGPQTLNLTGISAGTGETQALQITAVSDNPALLPDPTINYSSPDAVGSLAHQPVAYHFGAAHVVVTVRDAGLDGILGNADDATATQTFTVTVNHVNQTPTLDTIADPARVDINAGLQTVNLTGISAGPGDNQALQITATSDNAALIPDPVVSYTSPDGTGALSYQPATSASGAAHITVTVRDAGLDGIPGNFDDGVFSRLFTVVVNSSSSTPCLYDPTLSGFMGRGANSDGVADFGFGYGAPGSHWTPLAGDWDGDGYDGVGFYDPATSRFYLRNALTPGYADYTVAFGVPHGEWIPLAGDWNGDGQDTIGCYDPRTSTFYLRNSFTTGAADVAFGYGSPRAEWTPFAGDWDGNGVDTVGLFDSERAMFYLRNTNNNGVADVAFGFGAPEGHWKPLVGDWNGDGVDTIGCYDAAAAHWYLRNLNNSGPADVDFGFGSPRSNWKALVGNWNAASSQPLMAAGPVATAHPTTITTDDLTPIVSEAASHWLRAELTPRIIGAIAQAKPIVADLPGDLLGEVRGGQVYLDRDAAGRGWFVDPTPAVDEEFARLGTETQLAAIDAGTADKIDLLTVIEHELGHIAGLDDLKASPNSLMSGMLPIGVRRLATAKEIDDVFTEKGVW